MSSCLTSHTCPSRRSSSDASLSQDKKKRAQPPPAAPVRRKAASQQTVTVTLDLTNLSDSDSNSSFTNDCLRALKPTEKKLEMGPEKKSADADVVEAIENTPKPGKKAKRRSSGGVSAKSFFFSAPLNVARPIVTVSANNSANSNMLWIDRYAPTSIDELAVHAKKISAVKEWLKDSLSSFKQYGKGAAQKMLVLTGPPGCGKTAALRIVAKELNVEVLEWINEPQMRHADMEGWSSVGFENQMLRFEDFLRRVRHYPTLQLEGEGGAKNKVILVEDLPYLSEEREQVARFRESIRSFLNEAVFPLVFILCDSAEGTSSLDAVLGDVKNMRRRFEHITFNATNATLIAKTLSRICESEGVRFAEEKTVFKQICDETKGDMRAAINALQMVCVGQNEGEGKKSNRVKKKKAAVKYLELGKRDSSLSIFHGLGKVFHPKRDPESGKLLSSAEKIAQKMPIEASLQILFLHENYLSFFGNLNDCVSVLENLSFSDVLLESHFGSAAMESMANSVAIRGMIDPKFELANKRMIPFFRAKCRDFDLIRKSTRETANALFRDERVSRGSLALGDLGSTVLDEMIPWLGKIMLTKVGDRPPDAALLPRFNNSQLQFIYGQCVLQPRNIGASKLGNSDGEGGEFRNAGLAAEAFNKSLIAAVNSGDASGAVTDDFDPVAD